MNGNDKEVLKRSIVINAQEVVKNEIWVIVVDVRGQTGMRIRERFHILYETCEVIALPAQSKSAASGVFSGSELQSAMRSDWSIYAAARLQDEGTNASLLSTMKWNNEEEYYTGISRHWLAMIKAEGFLGEYKRKVAIRYVLASVVGNR